MPARKGDGTSRSQHVRTPRSRRGIAPHDPVGALLMLSARGGRTVQLAAGRWQLAAGCLLAVSCWPATRRSVFWPKASGQELAASRQPPAATAQSHSCPTACRLSSNRSVHTGAGRPGETGRTRGSRDRSAARRLPRVIDRNVAASVCVARRPSRSASVTGSPGSSASRFRTFSGGITNATRLSRHSSRIGSDERSIAITAHCSPTGITSLLRFRTLSIEHEPRLARRRPLGDRLALRQTLRHRRATLPADPPPSAGWSAAAMRSRRRAARTAISPAAVDRVTGRHRTPSWFTSCCFTSYRSDHTMRLVSKLTS